MDHQGVIVVTGAGSGIGRATAQTFLQAGWQVALAGRRVEPLEESAMGAENAIVHACDVGDAASVAGLFSAVVAKWGRVDVLFNNAGVSAPAATIDEIDVDRWLDVCRTNITGSFLCARAAFAVMRVQAPMGGRIINNGSISAHVPRPGSAPYTMSKHAVTGLTRTLGLDGRAYNIACGQIDIGNALTDMARSFPQGAKQADGSVKAEATMDVMHVARAVLQMAQLPLDVNVPFMTLMARDMPYIGRG